MSGMVVTCAVICLSIERGREAVSLLQVETLYARWSMDLKDSLKS